MTSACSRLTSAVLRDSSDTSCCSEVFSRVSSASTRSASAERRFASAPGAGFFLRRCVIRRRVRWVVFFMVAACGSRAAAADYTLSSRDFSLPDAQTIAVKAKGWRAVEIDLILDFCPRDHLTAAAARKPFAQSGPHLRGFRPRQRAGHDLRSHSGGDTVGLRRLPFAPHPAVAVDQRLTVAANRVVGCHWQGADRTQHSRARDMLDSSVRSKDDILTGHDAHATR